MLPNTVDAKLKVTYKDAQEDLGFSVRLKMIKDEVIWLKGTKIITVFKAKITPDKVSFYSPYKKNYLEGDFSMLKEMLGVDINFEQLQNLLLGQSIYNLKERKHEVQIIGNKYQLTPKKQADPIVERIMMIAERLVALEKEVAELKKKVK